MVDVKNNVIYNWKSGIRFKHGATKKSHRTFSPIFSAPSIDQQPAKKAYTIVLKTADAKLFRTPIDNQINTGKATFGNRRFINSQTDVGGQPKPGSRKRSAHFDSDQDRMPDTREASLRLNSRYRNIQNNRNKDRDDDGYSNLEENIR